MTQLLACGAECALTATSAGHIDTLAGAFPTIENTIIEPGGGLHSWRFTGVATTATYVARTIAQTSAAARFYVRISAYPTGSATICNFVNTKGSATLIITSAGLVSIKAAAVASVSTGKTLALNTWYRIDWKSDASGATATTTVTVDGANSTTTTNVQTSANITDFRWGNNLTGGAITGPTMYYDQIVVDSLSTYPIGAGFVTGTSPTNEASAKTPYVSPMPQLLPQ